MALDELSHAGAAALAPVLRAVTAALREVTGCAKTYVELFAEAEGPGHVRFHVVPCPAVLDPQPRGPRMFALLGGDLARHVPDSARGLCERIIEPGQQLGRLNIVCPGQRGHRG